MLANLETQWWLQQCKKSFFGLVSNEGKEQLGGSVRNSAHGKGHEEGGLAYAKA